MCKTCLNYAHVSSTWRKPQTVQRNGESENIKRGVLTAQCNKTEVLGPHVVPYIGLIGKNFAVIHDYTRSRATVYKFDKGFCNYYI